MKPYKIEIENGVEYVVINLTKDEFGEWKKWIKENLTFLKKPYFKLIVTDDKGLLFIYYFKRYDIHNEHGPAYIMKRGNVYQWYLNNIQCTEEEFTNEMRNKKLNNILDD